MAPGGDPPATLDPSDWREFEQIFHRHVNSLVSDLQNLREGPVWRPPQPGAKPSAAPWQGVDLATMCDEVVALLPYGTGNRHPRFFGWVHGAGTPAGVIAEASAAALNANCGGRDHIATYIERQVVAWFAEVIGLPETSGGLLLSGTSMANLVALAAARERATGGAARRDGLRDGPALVVYGSAGAHVSLRKAVELLGLGRRSLRIVPVTPSGAMRSEALAEAIAADRDAGALPMAIVATAGTASVGAVDPIAEVADIAARTGTWFHVDGAFGALARLDPGLAPLVAGIERADSIALDFHKWLHVPYDAGCVLVRDAAALPAAFAADADYLATGLALAGGAPWFTDLGPELSRGFRALKVWFTVRHFGLTRLGASIARTCALARRMAAAVETLPGARLLVPVGLNIVCFRFEPGHLDPSAWDDFNADVVATLQERGLAAPSTTRVAGQLAIRAAVLNHRTTEADIDGFVADAARVAAELAARSR